MSSAYYTEKVLPETAKMFEMWNNVSTKLEQVQQSQTQQPHTSSGSIKGILIYLRFYNFVLLTQRLVFHLIKMYTTFKFREF